MKTHKFEKKVAVSFAILALLAALTTSLGWFLTDYLVEIRGMAITQREITFMALTIGFLVIVVPAFGIFGWILGHRLTKPLGELTDGAMRIASGDLSFRVDIRTNDEVETLAQAINNMTDQLSEMVFGLEQRVVERTRELSRKTNYLEAASAVAHAASSILDTDQLVSEIVELIRNRFLLYYVGLFLVDEEGQWAVLKAGSGEAGRILLGKGFRIQVGQGMVGWCIANQQARVALEVENDQVRIAQPELPNTRSEAALPLRTRGQVIGAISVQSEQQGAFDSSTLALLQSMADQVAVALENARLFAQRQASLENMQRAYGELTHKTWNELVRSRSEVGYQMNERGLKVLVEEPVVELPPESLATNGQELMMPIYLRGQYLGSLTAKKPLDENWSPEEVELVRKLADQLSVTLESARLYQETQRRAERERIAGQITAKIRSSNNPQTILLTAAQELRKALQTQKAQILIHSKPIMPNPAGNGDQNQSGPPDQASLTG